MDSCKTDKIEEISVQVNLQNYREQYVLDQESETPNFDTEKWNKDLEKINKEIFQESKLFPMLQKFCKTTTMKNKVITLLDLNNTLNYDREIEKDNVLQDIKLIWDEVNYIKKLARFDGGALGRSDFSEKQENTIEIANNKLNKYKELQFEKLDQVYDDSDKLETAIQKMNERILNKEFESTPIEEILNIEPNNNTFTDNHSYFVERNIEDKIPLSASKFDNQNIDNIIENVDSSKEIKTSCIKNTSESYTSTIFLDSHKENIINQITPSNIKTLPTQEIVDKLNEYFITLNKPFSYAKISELPANPNQNTSFKQLGRVKAANNQTKFKTKFEKDDEIYNFDHKLGEDRQDLIEISNNYRYSIDKLEECQMELSKQNKILHDNGGLNCGWSSEDHQTFLKVTYSLKCSATHCDPEVVLSSIKLEIPMIGDKQIYEHIERHKKYSIIDKKRKQVFYTNNLLKTFKVRLEDEWKKMYQKEKIENLAGLKKVDLFKKRNMVKIWKKEKVDRVLHDAEDYTREKGTLDLMRKQNEIKERKYRDQINRQVAEYRENKETKKVREEEYRDFQEQQEMLKRKVKLSKTDKQRIFKRENDQFFKKLDKLNNIEIDKFDKNARMESIKIKNKDKFNSVTTRLMEETANTVSKHRDKFDVNKDTAKYAMNMGGNMVRTTGRALRNW